MLRDHLIAWLLHSTLPCWVGLHMPLTDVELTEDGSVVSENWECAACGKALLRG